MRNIRVKTGRVKNFDTTQESNSRRTSKLDGTKELVQRDRIDSQSINDNNVTIVKENEKIINKPLLNNKAKRFSFKNNQSIRKTSETSSISSSDTNNTSVYSQNQSLNKKSISNSDSFQIKKKWKMAFNAIKFNLKTKPNYEEIEESETNEKLKTGSENMNTSETSLTSSDSISIKNAIGDSNTTRRRNKESKNAAKNSNKGFPNNNSFIRSAIPSLPLAIAIICLIFNFIIPGAGNFFFIFQIINGLKNLIHQGTVLSGILITCFGEARLSSKDGGQKILSMIVNVIVGICQLITTLLLLVGWFWSISWGVYMVIIARKYF